MSTKRPISNERGDSYEEIPTYIKHWEEAIPNGWEIRILSETGLKTIKCIWKKYKRPHELSKRERCPHN
tara:strand:+ start:721 stop:927 length:207 start_codon:yes stop_codon:yes gene_type:complete